MSTANPANSQGVEDAVAQGLVDLIEDLDIVVAGMSFATAAALPQPGLQDLPLRLAVYLDYSECVSKSKVLEPRQVKLPAIVGFGEHRLARLQVAFDELE